ncbi:UNVERIFIED_CONTAM: hypothetical protein FKN15_018329 [Acipenser sinensis]
MSKNKRLPSDLTKKIFSVFLDFEADCPLVDKTVVEPAKSLKTISTSSEEARFLFYKRDSGNTSTFESTQFRGWFISNDRNKDISTASMCNGTDATGRITLFYLSRITLCCFDYDLDSCSSVPAALPQTCATQARPANLSISTRQRPLVRS